MNLHGRVLSDQPDLHYELFAVSLHYGSMGGGHCTDCIITFAYNHFVDTALAKNPLDREWYEFDDSSVRPLDRAQVEGARQPAYLLFYQRKAKSGDASPS